jgi:hypothetical protein
MNDVLHVIGPPTEAGAWSLSIAVGQDVLRGLERGDLVNTSMLEDYSVPGIVEHVQQHDDRVVATVLADTLELPAGCDDWRLALAPEVIAELVDEDSEDGWSS